MGTQREENIFQTGNGRIFLVIIVSAMILLGVGLAREMMISHERAEKAKLTNSLVVPHD